jgi:hypothetical protein
MSNEIDLNILMPLLEEVRTVFTSDNFLSGYDPPEPIIRMCDEEEFRCQIKDLDFYHYCILSANENTPYTEMDSRLIEYTGEIFYSLGNYSTQQFKEFITNFRSSITDITDHNPKLFALVENIIKNKKIEKGDIIAYKNHVIVTVARHVAAIIQMRTITLSRRFIPLELILDAYRKGLYPFGWSFKDNTIYCLNPAVCGKN